MRECARYALKPNRFAMSSRIGRIPSMKSLSSTLLPSQEEQVTLSEDHTAQRKNLRASIADVANTLREEITNQGRELCAEIALQGDTFRTGLAGEFERLRGDIRRQTEVISGDFGEQLTKDWKAHHSRFDRVEHKLDALETQMTYLTTETSSLRTQVAGARGELTEVKISVARIEGPLRPRLIVPD